MNHFNWPLFALLVPVLVFPAALRLWLLLRKPKTKTSTITTRETFTFVFTSSDRGRKWEFAGRELDASPLTDRLQDAYWNHRNGKVVEDYR